MTMTNEVHASSTWHIRLVEAVAKASGCTTTARRVPRIIGGRKTAKTDRVVRFEGDEAAAAEAVDLLVRFFGDLTVRSNIYLRTLTDLSPAERKLARRAWLEKEATKVAEKLTGDS